MKINLSKTFIFLLVLFSSCAKENITEEVPIIEIPEGRGILLESALGVDYTWNDKYNKILKINRGIIETTFTYQNGVIAESQQGESKTTVEYNETNDKVIEKRFYFNGVLSGIRKSEWENGFNAKNCFYKVNEDGSSYLTNIDSIYESGGTARRHYYQFDEFGNKVGTYSEYDVSYDNMKNPYSTLPLAYQIFTFGSTVNANNLVKRSLFYAHDNSEYYTNYHQYNSFKYPTSVIKSWFDDDPDTKGDSDTYFFYYIFR